MVAAAPAAAARRQVRVRKDDWLARILRQHVAGPAWGAQGSVARCIPLNPHIADANRIEPGEIIYLPDDLPQAPARPRIPGTGGGLWAGGHRGRPRGAVAARRRGSAFLPPPSAPDARGRAAHRAGSSPPPACPPPPPPCPPSACPTSPPSCATSALEASRPEGRDPHPVAAGPGWGGGGGPGDGTAPRAGLSVWATPRLSFAQLASRDDNTGKSAQITSSPSPGLEVGLNGALDGMWLARLAAGLRTAAFGSPDPSRVGLENGNVWLPRAYLGLGVAPLARAELWLELGMTRNVFLGARATQHLILQPQWSPEARLRLFGVVFARARWSLGLEARAAYLGASGDALYGSELGAAAVGQLRLGRSVSAQARIDFGQRRQDTALTSQGEQLLGIGVGLTWQLVAAQPPPLAGGQKSAP